MFLHICLQEGRIDNLLVILKQKRGKYLYGKEKLKEKVMPIKIARNLRYTCIVRSGDLGISTSFVAGGD